MNKRQEIIQYLINELKELQSIKGAGTDAGLQVFDGFTKVIPDDLESYLVVQDTECAIDAVHDRMWEMSVAVDVFLIDYHIVNVQALRGVIQDLWETVGIAYEKMKVISGGLRLIPRSDGILMNEQEVLTIGCVVRFEVTYKEVGWYSE